MEIENMTLEDFEKVEFLPDEVIREMNFAELCIYQEMLNKLKARYDELTSGQVSNGEGTNDQALNNQASNEQAPNED